MFCQNCGNKMDDGEKFCPGCGTPVSSDGAGTKQDSVINPVQTQPVAAPVSGVSSNQNSTTAKEQSLNVFIISSIILMVIGVIASLIGRVTYASHWWYISDLTFFSGVILAFISLNKARNKIVFVVGIVANAFYLLLAFLTIIGLIG